jgi:hypothetical protein
MILILFVIWLLYSIAEGIREALADAESLYDWHYKHFIYTFQRCLMAIVIGAAYYFYIDWWLPCMFMAFILILSFSFLHNGFYCMFSNIFSGYMKYPKGFFDKGTEDKSLNFSFTSRLIMLVISSMLLIMLISCTTKF